MSDATWHAVTGIFQAALQQPGGERDAFLEQQCGGDQALRAAVERLLHAHEHAGESARLTEQRTGGGRCRPTWSEA